MHIGIVFLIIVSISLLSILIFKRMKHNFPHLEFFQRGKESGLSIGEIKMLKKIALKNRLKKPLLLYSSKRYIDSCLRSMIPQIRSSSSLDTASKAEAIGKLMGLRSRFEYIFPDNLKRVWNSTALVQKQKITLMGDRGQMHESWVVEVYPSYLAVACPDNNGDSTCSSWQRKKLIVLFSRKHDARYSFETKVIKQIQHEDFPLLHLSHSTSLKRMQQRRNPRVKMWSIAQFKPFINKNGSDVKKAVIGNKTYRGHLLNISGGGCAMVAGRGLKENCGLRLEFSLGGGTRITGLGSVVGITDIEREKAQKYHIAFRKISRQSVNDILLYVYNIFGDRVETEENQQHQEEEHITA